MYGKTVSRLLVLGALGSLSSLVFAQVLPGQLSLVSQTEGGTQGDRHSGWGSISGDGRLVAFSSYSTNLAPNDLNNAEDAFVKDLLTGQVTLVGTTYKGVQGKSGSGSPVLSVNGRYVVFYNFGDDMYPGLVGSIRRIYRKDLWTGELRLVSARDDWNGPNGFSYEYAVSADGRFVAFTSNATNLVPEDTDEIGDLYLKDLATGSLRLIGTRADRTKQNGLIRGIGLSADGRYATFATNGNNLVPSDRNNTFDVFVKDVRTGSLELISQAPTGGPTMAYSMNPSISGDGRYVAFVSAAAQLAGWDGASPTGLFVKDRWTGRVSVAGRSIYGIRGNGSYFWPHISLSGRYLAFTSYASNLVPGDHNSLPDTFVQDLVTGDLRLASPAVPGIDGGQSDQSHLPNLNATGSHVTFWSLRTDLIPNDTNNGLDQFVFRTGFDTGTPSRLRITAGPTLVGKKAVLTAVLRDSATGSPNPGVPVRFFLDYDFLGEPVTTDEKGVAKAFVVVPEGTSIGGHVVGALFAGTDQYSTSSCLARIEVQPGPVRVAVPSLTAQAAARLVLRAKLTNDSRQPIRNRLLRFWIDTRFVGSATTDETGVARLIYTLPASLGEGVYVLKAGFGGDRTHTAGTSEGSLTVQ